MASLEKKKKGQNPRPTLYFLSTTLFYGTRCSVHFPRLVNKKNLISFNVFWYLLLRLSCNHNKTHKEWSSYNTGTGQGNASSNTDQNECPRRSQLRASWSILGDQHKMNEKASDSQFCREVPPSPLFTILLWLWVRKWPKAGKEPWDGISEKVTGAHMDLGTVCVFTIQRELTPDHRGEQANHRNAFVSP